ncbi:PTHB1 N-terminus-containing protein [Spironucleus salmonicida]|uniref:PTHB1 N-terminus-containing protein n=1 Tax=Spironucleus salmonicida TaxID=348837 RepID=V6M3E6_9EUKA|nr:PTHB1 N-terminus-containing protein [Spironucleus salmonicida]|eukprot:EST47804.1 hypothetical protein SS50377_12205 [Spironucleus salmonicida]
MYPIRTLSSIQSDIGQDIDTTLTANLLRMKQVQLITGSTSGNIQIFKVSQTPSPQDLLINHQTSSAIVGLQVGFFSSMHNSLDDSERLELAVIHPNSIEILQPKKSQTNSIELQQLVSIQINKIGSFTVAHRPQTQLDENKNKRTFISSYLIIKTFDSQLLLIQRKILAKLKLSFRYSLPSPISYSPLSDTLIISTFEYSVLAIDFQDLLTQQDNSLASQDEEKLKVKFEVVLNDRIQQLHCGRFFRSDSQKTGEICVVTPRNIVFFDLTGKLVKEVKIDNLVVKLSFIYSQSTKYSEIISTLILTQNSIQILSSGIIKWKGIFSEKLVVQTVKDDQSLKIVKQEEEKPQENEDEFIITPKHQIQQKQTFKAPLKAQTATNFQLNQVLFPICISTSFSISQQFHASNMKSSPLILDQPGYFILTYSEGLQQVSFFGTTQQNFSKFQPIAIPTSQISKQIKEQLQQELQQTNQENKENVDQHLNIKIANITPTQNGIETQFQIEFESSLNVTNLTIQLSAFNQNFTTSFDNKGSIFQIDEVRSFKKINTICTITFPLNFFVSYQEIGFLACSEYNFQSLRTSVFVPLSLLSYNVFGPIPTQQFAYKIDLQFEIPFQSLKHFLAQKSFPEEILNELETKSLGIKNLDGSIAQISQLNNSTLQVSSNNIEQIFPGLDFLLSYELNYLFNFDKSIIITAISNLKNQSKTQNVVKIEDVLAQILQKFGAENEKVSTNLNGVYSERENFGENIEVITDYIEGLCSRITSGDNSGKIEIERLRGVACLLCCLKYKQVDVISQERKIKTGFGDKEGFEGIFGTKLENFLD